MCFKSSNFGSKKTKELGKNSYVGRGRKSSNSMMAPKKAKNLDNISCVIRDRKFSNFGFKKGKKNMSKTSRVVSDRMSSNFGSKKGKTLFGQHFMSVIINFFSLF